MLEANRRNIDGSKYFMALITENFYEDMEALECFLYAKQEHKPMIILMKEGTIQSIPDLLDNCVILETIIFHNHPEMSEKLRGLLEKLRDDIING